LKINNQPKTNHTPPPPPRGIPYPKDNGIQIRQEYLRLPKIALPPLLKEDLEPADQPTNRAFGEGSSDTLLTGSR